MDKPIVYIVIQCLDAKNKFEAKKTLVCKVFEDEARAINACKSWNEDSEDYYYYEKWMVK